MQAGITINSSTKTASSQSLFLDVKEKKLKFH